MSLIAVHGVLDSLDNCDIHGFSYVHDGVDGYSVRGGLSGLDCVMSVIFLLFVSVFLGVKKPEMSLVFIKNFKTEISQMSLMQSRLQSQLLSVKFSGDQERLFLTDSFIFFRFYFF